MFTVLSKTRNSNLYLIAALAVAMIVLLTFTVAPVISASRPAAVPVTGNTAVSSDYYQRHPELSAPSATVVDLQGDFFLRHPELSLSIASMFNTNDYFTRHPELRPAAKPVDLSDYFIRH